MPSQATPTGPQTQTADRIFDAVFEHSLDFRITLEFDDACQFIRRIDRYNEFDAERVIDALTLIDGLIPKMHFGEGNPNNGQRDFKISVGREGSPVIYIERYEFLTDKTILHDLTLRQQICGIMEHRGLADEASSESKGSLLRFRFWWD